MNPKIIKLITDLQENIPELEPDATNPHFGHAFISLSKIRQTLQPLLKEFGGSIIQEVTYVDNDTQIIPALRTTIAVKDAGESWSTTMLLTAKASDPQAQGSAVTYARRYSLLALLNIVPGESDDDGVGAQDVPVTKMMNEKDLIEVGQKLSAKGITTKADKVTLIQLLAGHKALNTSAVNRLKKAIDEAMPDTLQEMLLKGEII